MKKRWSPASFLNGLTLLWVFSAFLPGTISGQTDETAQKEVRATIQKLFDGMRASDSVLIKSVFHAEARLHTTFTGKDGKPQLRSAEIAKFIAQVGAKHEVMLDERIWNYDIRVDANLATAWTEYTFFLGEKMSHCGVNAFQLVKTEAGWQILNITDTRRTENCRTEAAPGVDK